MRVLTPEQRERKLACGAAWRKANRDKARAYYVAWRKANLERKLAANAAWHKANPDKARGYHLKRRYGMTLEEYNTKAAHQEGKCACCGEKPKKLEVDHCHIYGNVRDLLCHRCNDSIKILDLPMRHLLPMFKAYIDRHSTGSDADADAWARALPRLTDRQRDR